MTMVLGPNKKKAEARSDRQAEKADKAARRAAEEDAERAEREASRTTTGGTSKKARGRSENLDPEIDA